MMKLHGADLPSDLIQRMREEARMGIDPYCVSLVRDQTGFGSGTFVHAFGAYGTRPGGGCDRPSGLGQEDGLGAPQATNNFPCPALAR